MEIKTIETGYSLVESFKKSRDVFSDKRGFGHALVIAGSPGMMGAAVLAAGGALRSGCGLVTACIPESERFILQISHPSAIVSCYQGAAFTVSVDRLGYYTAVGAGCGLGQSAASADALSGLLSSIRSMSGDRPGLLLDADALNIIASHPSMYENIPSDSILTPHVRELGRLMRGLYGNCHDEKKFSGRPTGLPPFGQCCFEDWRYPWSGPEMAYLADMADRLSSVIVAKGHNTLICPPSKMGDKSRSRTVYVNTTGNAGMAKGGSGDVLAGLVTGLMARGYSPAEAAILGVWYHGRAGDDAAKKLGLESMNSSDILDNIHIMS